MPSTASPHLPIVRKGNLSELRPASAFEIQASAAIEWRNDGRRTPIPTTQQARRRGQARGLTSEASDEPQTVGMFRVPVPADAGARCGPACLRAYRQKC